MRYLAFDIEAANGYKHYSICSVGIVIADEQFNILYAQNILINPRTKYNLDGSRKNVDIDLHLDKGLLDASPDFEHSYNMLKGYLEGDYTIVGHAVESDVYMLNCACKHYKLPCINFKFICSQLLYRLHCGDREVKALCKIADAIGVEFCPHNSQDDALVSMLTLKYLVNTTGMTVEQLLDNYSVRIGENKDFEVTRTVSMQENVGKKHLVQKAREQIYAYISTNKFSKSSRILHGKVYALARSIELSPNVMHIIDIIYNNGGKYTSKLAQCNYYVRDDQCQSIDTARESRVMALVNDNRVTITNTEQLTQEVE
ncbi:MAG: hypothetical protein PHW00_01040 [Clostridia bacterium]|nr:hypothetical protein [Clostridia bacterium]